jgi:hypothetical protein
MSYWETSPTSNNLSADHYVTSTRGTSQQSEFYELEPGVVLEVVLDKSHAIFQSGKLINEEPWPADVKGVKPDPKDVNYTWIGRALVRLVNSSKNVVKERLIWAMPLESNISEYPLVNEMVVVGKHLGKYYYSKKLNVSNLVNHNVDFSQELYLGGDSNKELNSDEMYQGPLSTTSLLGGPGEEGVAGRYFWLNRNIRSIKRHEGDTLIESRFGQSIKFGAYDDDRNNDVGGPITDYSGKVNLAGINPVSQLPAGGGNPMILIRNRQRPILKEGESLRLFGSPNAATIKGSEEEKNTGGYISEDINHDGSSIHITSGQTITKWVTTCYKKMFGTGEEVSKFSGKTSFKYPEQSGDQIVINTDRLILSARYGETFHYSKKRYAVVTDSEYTVDAHDQIVFTTHVKTVLNSPAIYLGEYDNTSEPALLGQTTISWLYELCNWMLEHTHWYLHSHPDAGKASPEKTQLPVQVQKLIALRNKLHSLMSRRVFVTGGGFAPGQDGGNITNGSAPTEIDVRNGNGIPGGWKGQNNRKS